MQLCLDKAGRKIEFKESPKGNPGRSLTKARERAKAGGSDVSRTRKKGGKTRPEKAVGQWEGMRPGRQAFGA